MTAAQDLQRFKEEVEKRINAREPIYIQLGFGHEPFSNFLNLDISLSPQAPTSPDFVKNIFIFPWSEAPLPLRDNCVDFVFHQDMFEHLLQRQQFLVLAEVKRVLKPGCFHRINTPCIADSMRIYSDFSKGYEGVYQGEWHKWDHVNVLTRNMLEDMARIVGYSHVLFNSQNGSVSGVKFTEFRPDKDRHPLTGNIFADLMK